MHAFLARLPDPRDLAYDSTTPHPSPRSRAARLDSRLGCGARFPVIPAECTGIATTQRVYCVPPMHPCTLCMLDLFVIPPVPCPCPSPCPSPPQCSAVQFVTSHHVGTTRQVRITVIIIMTTYYNNINIPPPLILPDSPLRSSLLSPVSPTLGGCYPGSKQAKRSGQTAFTLPFLDANNIQLLPLFSLFSPPSLHLPSTPLSGAPQSQSPPNPLRSAAPPLIP